MSELLTLKCAKFARIGDAPPMKTQTDLLFGRSIQITYPQDQIGTRVSFFDDSGLALVLSVTTPKGSNEPDIPLPEGVYAEYSEIFIQNSDGNTIHRIRH